MNGPIKLTLATAGRNGTRIATQLINDTTGLTVAAVTTLDPIPDADVVEAGECVVAIVAEELADASTVYEEFRRTYPTQPLIMVTGTDDPVFIESLLDDDYGDYVYLPAGDMPFGLIAVRCKRLIERTTRT